MENYLRTYDEMNFKVSHIYREENYWAKILVNLGIENKLDFKWNSTMPLITSLDSLFHNRFQFAMFTFV